MEVYNETVIDHINGEDHCNVSSGGDRKVSGLLKKLAEKHPEQCVLMGRDRDGSVWYHVPWDWITIRPPIVRKYTEEQRAAARERMIKIRETNGNNRNK